MAAPLVQTEPILEGFDVSSCGNEDVPKADEEYVFVSLRLTKLAKMILSRQTATLRNNVNKNSCRASRAWPTWAYLEPRRRVVWLSG